MGDIWVRVLKDSCCQSNLISSELVQNIPHQVIQSGIELNFRGVPGSKRYLSDLVKFTFQVGDLSHKAEAYTLDDLSFRLNNPSVYSIASQFRQRGYDLADSNLLKTPSRVMPVNLILGVKSAHVLPEREILFGLNRNSMFSITPVGVLLKGDVETLGRNVSLLSRPKTEYCLFSSIGDSSGGFLWCLIFSSG